MALLMTAASLSTSQGWRSGPAGWPDAAWFTVGRPAEAVLAIAAGTLAAAALRDRAAPVSSTSLRLLPAVAFWSVATILWAEFDGSLGRSLGRAASSFFTDPLLRPHRFGIVLAVWVALVLLVIPRLSDTALRKLPTAVLMGTAIPGVGTVLLALTSGAAGWQIGAVLDAVAIGALVLFGLTLSVQHPHGRDTPMALATWFVLWMAGFATAATLLSGGSGTVTSDLLRTASPLITGAAMAAAVGTQRLLAQETTPDRPAPAPRGAAPIDADSPARTERSTTPGAWSVILGHTAALAILASGRLGVALTTGGLANGEGDQFDFPTLLSTPLVGLCAASAVLLAVGIVRLFRPFRSLAP